MMTLSNIEKLTKKTFEISDYEKKAICYLKSIHWKFKIDDQLKWFDKNIHLNDIHNLCLKNNKLIGYTALRFKECIRKTFDNQIRDNVLIFDTLIVDPEYRSKGLGSELMKFNNKVIKETKLTSFLLCKQNVINFYKKNGWKLLNSNQFQLINHKSSSNGMIYNYMKSQHDLNMKHFNLKIFFK